MQETHLHFYDNHALKHALPDHTIYYNNGKHKRAGTMIIIDNRLKSFYTFTPTHPCTAHPGRIQVLDVLPRPSATGTPSSYPLQIINLYLPNDHKKKRPLLTHLLHLPRAPTRTTRILLGDLNFIEHPTDSSPPSTTLALDHKTQRLWHKILKKFHLKEISQPIHTHYFITSDILTSRSSRIDRIYASYNSAEDAIIHPITFIPHLPNNKTANYQRLLHDDNKPVIPVQHPPPLLRPRASRTAFCPSPAL